MTELEALERLRELDTVTVAEGALANIKELQLKCLAEDIPALAARPDDSCKTGGCSVKLRLIVGADDVSQVAALLDREWRQLLAREGTVGELIVTGAAELGPDDEPPCPACGTAAPLVEGACSDCGLVLA